MLVFWLALGTGGLALALVGSRRSLAHATALADQLGVPPFLVGVSLVAVGTDLPEIANSIISSLSGHGDINLGDSIGSVYTQCSLALGLLPWVGGALPARRREIVVAGVLTLTILALGAALTGDGFLSRPESLLLLGAWLLATPITWRITKPQLRTQRELPLRRRPGRDLALALAWLTLVGAGAAGLVHALVQVSRVIGLPEYVLSFLGASIGTSLPEIIVDTTAVRQRRWDLALGDIFGSCLIDASLSLAIGPLLVPIAVTGDLALAGGALAAFAVAAATVLLATRQRLDRAGGATLLGLYAAGWLLMGALG